jgi:uncharacterized protein with HEPN domain
MGEAAKNISPAFNLNIHVLGRDRWIRDKLIHFYFGIDKIVWGVVKKEF